MTRAKNRILRPYLDSARWIEEESTILVTDTFCVLTSVISRRKLKIFWESMLRCHFVPYKEKKNKIFLFSLYGTTVECEPSPPYWTSPHSALFNDISFQSVILHLLTAVCTHLHHLFFDRPLSRLPWGLLNTWLTFLSISILQTRPIQFNRLILTNSPIRYWRRHS
jgi:hypothetical protein